MEKEIVIKKATEVLFRELGPVEAIRFTNIPKKKRLESVKRHREWQKLLDKNPPDGTPRKLLDVTWVRNLGWSPEISIEEGIKNTYNWYCDYSDRANR